jgi:chromate transporter
MIPSAADPKETPQDPPTLLELFIAFFGMSIVGFGGVLPWAQRMLVDQRRWMTVTEFAEALAIAQFLPGGNILNMSVAIGQRFRGPLGSLVSVLGLLTGPTVLVMVLGAIYLRYGQIQAMQDVLGGVAAAAAGLIISMVVRLARPLIQRGDLAPGGFAVGAFCLIVLFKAPLIVALATVAPLSIAYQWWRRP